MVIPTDRRRRVASAILFLFGLIASMNAVRDERVLWPPAALWAVLSPPHRLQLCGGIALILVSLFMTIFVRRD